MKENHHLIQTTHLPVVETFSSIQGEGLHTGKPAFFIRLGGCDVCCTWCDEKIAWDESLYDRQSVDMLVEMAMNSRGSTVVVTGGEPFRHNLNQLSTELKKRNILCMAETSGTAIITGKWDWITLSPKQQQPPLLNNLQMADELKVVIQKTADFEWAEENALKTKSDAVLYLQPEWSRFHEILPEIIRYIQQHLKWRLSVQVHKFLNIP
jgi:7-carboxy-7-deazaguanine synthase